MWNWTRRAWETLKSSSVGTTQATCGSLSPSGTLSNYASGTGRTGDVRVRVQCTAGSPGTAYAGMLNLTY